MTFALIAVCLCVFSATRYTARQAQELAEGELQVAIAYLLEHP